MTTPETRKTPRTETFKRKERGFMRAGGLLAARIRKATEKRGFTETRLLTHWAEFVGPAVAKMARPLKVRYTKKGFGATLTVLSTGPNAPMLQMQLPYIIERVNACYGYAAISKIRITQTTPAGFEEAQTSFERPKDIQPLSETAKADVNKTVASVSDQSLKEALTQLGTHIKQNSQKGHLSHVS